MLRCILVNMMVFKHDHITLALALSGLGTTCAQGAARARAVELGQKGMHKLYRGMCRAEGP
jgi:hypothetical protein